VTPESVLIDNFGHQVKMTMPVTEFAFLNLSKNDAESKFTISVNKTMVKESQNVTFVILHGHEFLPELFELNITLEIIYTVSEQEVFVVVPEPEVTPEVVEEPVAEVVPEPEPFVPIPEPEAPIELPESEPVELAEEVVVDSRPPQPI